jgi:4-amino-4-deoxy-L-arabinose transferase-like glycosyltransferase
MENILGWSFLLIILFFIFFWTKKYPHIKNFLLVAFLLRALCVIFDNHDLITLPDSTADAQTFERKARYFSNNYGLLVVKDFFRGDSLLMVRIISVFYTIFGESKMMAQSISVALGTASVYLVYLLSSITWDQKSATKAAWVVALFPSLILYSSLTLREVYIVFLLLVGLIGIARYIRNNTINSFLQVLLSFYALIFFHGAASLGGFIFLFYVLLNSIKKQLINLFDLKINILSLMTAIIASIPVVLFLTNNLSIPYMPSLYDLPTILFQSNVAIKFLDARSAYPDWFMIKNIYELIPKTILKTIYFLYSPFVWDIKTNYHMIGFFDTIPYFVLTIYLIQNKNAIWANPVARIFIIIFFVYIIIHGLGVGNFGTAIRHKSKFVVIMIVLAAPKINKFVFSVQKKIYKSVQKKTYKK